MKKTLFLFAFSLLFISCKESYKNSAFNHLTTHFLAPISKFNAQNEDAEYYFKIPDIPDKITFAGEEIDFTDWDIRERMDRELIVNNYWHSNTILMMKRAHRWLPLIRSILKEEKLPEDLAYIALIESGLTNAVSPAGAKGFWQFMETTGKEYQLTINTEIDERYDVEKSTYAACKYLKKAYHKFGTWTLVAAAYNRGMNGIERDLKEQKVDSFFDLSLNQETSRYVFRIFALKMIFENPKEYGFNLPIESLYEPYQTIDIEVDSTITNIYDWAIENRTNMKLVRKLNPWIIGKKLTVNEGSKFIIKLPKNKQQLGMINK